MATKKKPTPKPIQYRGLTLNFDKRKEQFATEDGKIAICKEHWANDVWFADVKIDSPCPDDDPDGTIIHRHAETPQEAIDLALDAALERIDLHMKPMVDQKTNFLKIRNS